IVSLKISKANDFVRRHIGNLKPLVGFNSAKAYALVLELLDQLKDSPTMEDFVENKTIEVKVYNPGQFTTKGVEKFARKLFTSRYGARSPNTVFFLDGIKDRTVFLKVRKTKMAFEIPESATVFSLKTYSKVNHMDINR
ncbi:MAG: hypothetical protein QXZ02_07445, partial [Candidatus Bathyarchaeia archaeon]